MTVTSKWVALHEVSDYLAKGWREVQIIGGLDDAALMASPEEPASEGGKVEPFCRYCAGYAVAAEERQHSYTCNRPRHQDKPAKVRMTPELENLLKLADYAEVAMRTGFNPPYLLIHNELRAAIKVVREKFQ